MDHGRVRGCRTQRWSDTLVLEHFQNFIAVDVIDLYHIPYSKEVYNKEVYKGSKSGFYIVRCRDEASARALFVLQKKHVYQYTKHELTINGKQLYAFTATAVYLTNILSEEGDLHTFRFWTQGPRCRRSWMGRSSSSTGCGGPHS